MWRPRENTSKGVIYCDKPVYTYRHSRSLTFTLENKLIVCISDYSGDTPKIYCDEITDLFQDWKNPTQSELQMIELSYGFDFEEPIKMLVELLTSSSEQVK